MLDLFRGEAYRILHKRKMYLYLGAVLLGYAALIFMRSGNFTANSVATDTDQLFQFLPPLLGGYFFTSLYTDDFVAKNLITLVGYGTSRTRIILTKFLLMTICTTIAFAVLTALHFGLYAAFGFAATGPAISYVLAFALKNLLLTIGFALVATVVAYATQKSTFAVVAYFMLAFNVVSTLIRVAASYMHLNIADRLLSGTTTNIVVQMLTPGGNIAAPGLELLAYLGLAIVASIIVFKRRELEF
jgi:ABC-type transport system involved in multi-copper enzyme maturation permease subunit